MLKLVVAFALLGAVAAGVYFVPVRGRTIEERWSAAPSAGAFLRDGWNEALAAFSGREKAPPARPSPLPAAERRRTAAATPASSRRAGREPPHPAPAEHYTPEDRAALDRLLSEHAR